MIRKITSLLFVLLMLGTLAYTQSPVSMTSSEILLRIRKLNVLGSVLYVAAHPDDENTRLLAYFANEKLYKTAYLSMTRGDGGQNLIGDEQGVELGLIRTQELMAARRIDGAEQFFTRAYDFGYSKKPEETMRIWGHDKILYDVVKIIRMNKPDVIICRFPTTGEGGHGHHTASAMLAQEAFEAAADSSRFTDQLKDGITTWQAKRLLWNTFNFGSVNTQKEDQFKLDAGLFNPLLGKTYGEIAALSRSQHKSQGFGVPAQRGAAVEYFTTIRGDAPAKDLLDGVNTGWSRIGQSDISACIDTIISNYDISHPEKSVKGLFALGGMVGKMQGNDFWKQLKLKEIKEIILACSGIYAEAISSEEKIVENDSMNLNLSFFSRTSLTVGDIEVRFRDSVFSLGALAANKSVSQSRSVLFNGNHELSQPYWLTNEKSEGSFNVPDSSFTGAPQNKPVEVEFSCKIDGQSIRFSRPVQYKYTDPVKGEFFQPVVIVPLVSIRPSATVMMSHSDDFSPADVEMTAFAKTDSADLKLVASDNYWNSNVSGIEPPSIGDRIGDRTLSRNLYFKKNEKKSLTVSLKNGINNLAVKGGRVTYSQQLHSIQYDHVPHISYYSDATVKLVRSDIRIAGRKIGYIEGAGDKVAECLSQVGYAVTNIRREDITGAYLKQFDAIVTGVRAYNTNEWMNEVYDPLMEYVLQGGVLLVQYNTSNQLGPLKSKISPFPFTITRNRVTDEKASMTMLQPRHAVFNRPNRITQKDFEGWVQERSIYHAGDIDSGFVRLIASNDPGEKADDGSLIVASYGKGKFIYTGIAFFRQLPAGIPGAYRIFANLLAR